MRNLLLVGAGGFVGCCLRYLIGLGVSGWGAALPLGTLFANTLAGLAIGVLIGVEQQLQLVSPAAKLFIATGLLGGLSTFSAFSLETVELLQNGKNVLAMGNVAVNLALSLGCTALGLALLKLLAKSLAAIS